MEVFRILRTNLQFVDVDRHMKAFVVTSSVPGEGKTSTASNIALALQTAGERTLLIDGDMRRPQLSKLFSLEGSVGLPLLPVTDAALIAAQADGAVLVVRQGKTTWDQFSSSLDRLQAVGARPLGVTMNMVAHRGRKGYGYGYGYAPTEGRRVKEPVK